MDTADTPEAPSPAARHPFTSTFLVLFLLDGFWGFVSGLAYSMERWPFDPESLEDVASPFGLALLMGALVQMSLSFGRGMRWSARLIGVFVVAFQFLSMVAVLLAAAYVQITQGPEALASKATVFSDPVLGVILLVVNTMQLSLGLWAARDLSRGHYLAPA
jgi:hypothetical protein